MKMSLRKGLGDKTHCSKTNLIEEGYVEHAMDIGCTMSNNLFGRCSQNWECEARIIEVVEDEVNCL